MYKTAMLPTPPSPTEGFDPDEVLRKLTTAEKIDLLSGTDRLTIKSLDTLAHVLRH